MRFFSCLAAILFVGTASAQDRSRDKEIALGQQLAREFRTHATPFDDAEVAAYFRDTAARLAPEFPDGWPYQVEVVRENTGGALHEPATFPGGPVFVSVELLAEARNEAEFAGILAHAMAHIADRHGRVQIGQGPIVFMGGDSSLLPLGMRPAQRASENRADDLAENALSAAGYDPAGLASYLKRVQPPATPNQVGATLPDREQRVAAILAAIAKLPPREYQTDDQFARMQLLLKAH
jgi:beta-barrel assembly-enhancing protease